MSKSHFQESGMYNPKSHRFSFQIVTLTKPFSLSSTTIFSFALSLHLPPFWLSFNQTSLPDSHSWSCFKGQLFPSEEGQEILWPLPCHFSWSLPCPMLSQTSEPVLSVLQAHLPGPVTMGSSAQQPVVGKLATFLVKLHSMKQKMSFWGRLMEICL